MLQYVTIYSSTRDPMGIGKIWDLTRIYPGLSQKKTGNNCGSQQEKTKFNSKKWWFLLPCHQDACRRHRSAPWHDRSHRDLDIQEIYKGFLGNFEGFFRTFLFFFKFLVNKTWTIFSLLAQHTKNNTQYILLGQQVG